MSAEEVVTLRLKALGSKEIKTIEIPTDAESDDLLSIIGDMCPQFPSFKAVIKGKVITPGRKLVDIGVSDNELITIVANKDKPVKKTEDPPPPPVIAEPAPEQPSINFMNEFLELQTLLTDASVSLATLNTSLGTNEADTVNRDLHAAEAVMSKIEEKLTRFGQNDFLEASRMLDPAITDHDRAEMQRIATTLAQYAEGGRIAEIYRSSNLYESLQA